MSSFLQNFEEGMFLLLTDSIGQSLTATGVDNISMPFESQSAYLDYGGSRLAIVRSQSDYAYALAIAGIEEDQLRTVFCGWASPEQISYSDGKCGDKIKEVFKLNLGPLLDNDRAKAEPTF